MVCLGLEPGVAGWKAPKNLLSYGGTPKKASIFIIFIASVSMSLAFRCYSGQGVDGVTTHLTQKDCPYGTTKCKNSTLCKKYWDIPGLFFNYFCPFQSRTQLNGKMWNFFLFIILCQNFKSLALYHESYKTTRRGLLPYFSIQLYHKAVTKRLVYSSGLTFNLQL